MENEDEFTEENLFLQFLLNVKNSDSTYVDFYRVIEDFPSKQRTTIFQSEFDSLTEGR